VTPDELGVDLPPGVGTDTPVFVISVAATLAGMHPQTLRQYDRIGLVSPGRSSGLMCALARLTKPAVHHEIRR